MDLTPMVLKKYNKQQPKQLPVNPLKQPLADDIMYNTEIKYIKPELSKQFTQARINKGLTRKQLAQNLRIKESDVSDIENGTAKHNGNMITRFKKYLGLDNQI